MDVYDLAVGIAAELGPGWIARREEYGIYLVSGDARLAADEQFNRPGHLTVAGCYPKTSAERIPQSVITVRADRGVPVITREIRRRLLPGYSAQVQRILDYNAAEAYEDGLRQVMAEKVAALFPGSHIRQTGYRGQYTEVCTGAPAGACVTSHGDASVLSLDLHAVPAATALRMLEILAGAQS